VFKILVLEDNNMVDVINHIDFLGERPTQVRKFNSFRVTLREIIPTIVLHDH
jgi:hypothetical protein